MSEERIRVLQQGAGATLDAYGAIICIYRKPSESDIDFRSRLISAELERVFAEAGQSMLTAVKVTRDHGDDAGKEIDRREKVAQAAGKKKVTAKSAAKPAPKISNALIQAVRGFVKEIPEAIKERILLGQVQWVEVDASLLAEVIGAAAELVEDDGSVGGLDGQQELAV